MKYYLIKKGEPIKYVERFYKKSVVFTEHRSRAGKYSKQQIRERLGIFIDLDLSVLHPEEQIQ